ncbi:hypothetical protein FHS27_001715 [Rhodopirellula rubra]|uniref:Uncharacterized protein n=1 Tax=Aporhodopirellula rubra TaxID=980271 RepID=A0A7W5H5J8_9BACT|nr:hypothetical protein [Aporhodopirellula rubra]
MIMHMMVGSGQKPATYHIGDQCDLSGETLHELRVSRAEQENGVCVLRVELCLVHNRLRVETE